MDLIRRLVRLGYDPDTAIDIYFKHLNGGLLTDLEAEIAMREREEQ
jgi:hypothetical protein|nr:MAG TPA: E3 ubiquitin-protein ligase [Caudoviricetes sp.]